MPIYVVRCLECDKETEVLVRKPDAWRPPICCGGPMRKQVTKLGGFKFRTGGFSSSTS